MTASCLEAMLLRSLRVIALGFVLFTKTSGLGGKRVWNEFDFLADGKSKSIPKWEYQVLLSDEIKVTRKS